VQEKFRSLTRSFFRETHGVILVYDVTSAPSFDHVSSWLKDVSAVAPGITAVLVGNKMDLATSRVITTARGAALGKELGVPFFEASANTNVGVEPVFARMAEELVAKAMRELGVAGAAASAAAGAGDSGGAAADGGAGSAAPDRVKLAAGGGAGSGGGGGGTDAPAPSKCSC
jgi:hypothetical protein